MSEGKDGKKTLYVKEVHEIKEESGEVLKSARVESSMLEKEPPYVKLYIYDIAKLNGLSPSEGDILNELVGNMGYNNIVPSYKPVKEMMAKKLKMKYGTLDAGIKKLYKKGILIRKARGLYVMSPDLFGRGTWNDIKKIRMVIDYNSDGTKSINTELSNQLGLFD